MNTNDFGSHKSFPIVNPLMNVEDLDQENVASKAQREMLRLRVLDMLRNPDPVCGIYAMYGSHDRHPYGFKRHSASL